MNRNQIYQFREFILNTQEHTLRNENCDIHLRPKAFKTLVYLVERQGILIKKEKLLSDLWPNVIVTENTLSQCIDEIRKVLGDNARQPHFIQTIPRLGFKFIANVEVQESGTGNRNNTSNIINNDSLNFSENDTVNYDPNRNSKSSQLKLPLLTILAVLLLIVFGVWGINLINSSGFNKVSLTKTFSTEKRLAVLPFQNISPDSKDVYLANGITEELISTLSKITGLKIIGHTSLTQNVDWDSSINNITENLKVEYLLTGSVRKAGNKLRISVQLVDAKENITLWTQDYNRDLISVFAVQSDIAQSIAKEMRIHLLAGDILNIEKKQTDNIEAYILYLKGRHEWNKRTAEGFKKGFEYFNHAIEIDPEYALAYTGLADSYSWFAAYHIIPANEAYSRAKLAAKKALEIDNKLAEAHVSLAVILRNYYSEWSEAEKEFKLAIKLNPNIAYAHKEYSEYLMIMGRFNEALSESRLTLELDPLALVMNANLGHILYRARKYNEAILQLQKTIEMKPDVFLVTPYWHLGLSYIQNGMIDKAIEKLEKWRFSTKGNPDIMAVLAYAYGKAGKKNEAKNILKEFNNIFDKTKDYYHFTKSFGLALIYIGLGEKDDAFEWLFKANNEKSQIMFLLKTEPFFDPLRTDPRFSMLLKKKGFK